MNVVLITGAAKGLGASLANAFAHKKYGVAIHYHHSGQAADELVLSLQKAGVEAAAFRADLRQSGSVNQLMDRVAARMGRIDVLVNNAGSVANRTIARMEDQEWSDVLATNLSAPFYAMRAIIPIMRKQGGGSILNLVSYQAARPVKGAANYSAAKAGLIALSKAAAIEEGLHHIRVNAIMPGFHVTDINRDVWGRFEKDIRAQHILPKMPQRDEMAAFAVHVAELSTVTGQVFSFESRLV